ncbi:GEVED domain-containing protein [Cytophagaceae bacterium ABcell3]|nr:GEVED domain-containing protein [Cytophagaceae bacterium ABcell3]
MINRIYCLLLLTMIFCVETAMGQVSEGGEPLSFSDRLKVTNKVPYVTMPAFDIEAVQEEAKKNSKGKYHQFGHSLELNKGLDEIGLWEDIGNGDRIWRVGIRSEQAFAINLVFSRYKLPEGGKLFIYDASRSEVLGAFTSKNNQPDGMLGTMPVNGSEVVIEYFEPAESAGQGELVIGEVVHAFEDIMPIMKSYGLGQSGDCNMDVNCPDGEEWEKQKRSVALIVTGSGFCSGALVNNTAQDKKPLVLTANDCMIGSSSVSGWVFAFNFESAECDGNDSPVAQSISGAELRANFAYSGFALLEMHSAPPEDYNTYYSGWSRASSLATSTASIHHPQGDVKKISFDDNSVYDSDENEWRVQWDRNTVTETGSLGAPLFDQNQRIIGQLRRGHSSCDNQDGYEFFGKFNRSWEGGGTDNSRLKNWLDPVGADPEYLDGLDASGEPEWNYCVSEAAEEDGARIDLVVVGEDSLASEDPVCRKYSDFTDTKLSIVPDEELNLNVVTASCDDDRARKVKVWVDWSRDFDFDDEGELVAESEETDGGSPLALSFTVPEDVEEGAVFRMRVVTWESELDEDVSPCDIYQRGETQDFSLEVLYEGDVPVISDFSPSSGAPGDEVTITGEFRAIQEVLFGDIPASFTVVSESELLATVPSGFEGGHIAIKNPAGTVLSDDIFSFEPAYCTSMATTSNGAIITHVEFGDISEALSSSCRRYSNNTHLVNEMEYGASQELSVSVGACDEHYNKMVKVFVDWNGDGDFEDEGEELGVSPVFSREGTFDLLVEVPNRAVTARPVRMRIICWESSGMSDLGPCDSYNWGETRDYSIQVNEFEGDVPVISSFSPENGFPGDEVTILGSFEMVNGVTFNGVEAESYEVISSEEVRAIVPNGDVYGPIAVHNPAGAGESDVDFAAGEAPVIASFSPEGGTAGTQVTIVGSFESITSVTFNGIEAASFTVVSDSEIRAVVPEGDTEGTISVGNPAGTSTSEGVFSFVPSYCTSSPNSNSGARIDSVTIGSFTNRLGDNCRGYSDFTNMPKETYKGKTLPIEVSVGACRENYTKRVRIFADWDADGSFDGPGEIVATSPPYEAEGTFSTFLTIPDQASTSRPVRLRVVCWESAGGGQVDPCGSYAFGETQDYILDVKEYTGDAPVITSISPEAGEPGTLVTLEGENFEAITSISFGGAVTPVFNVESDSRITVEVPTGASTGPVIVTNPAGSGESSVFRIENYCVSQASSSIDTKIDRVLFGTIDNESGDCPVYTDFTDHVANVYPGQVLHLQVLVNSCGSLENHALKAYIDFDQNHEFDEVAELVASGQSNQDIYNLEVTIPEDLDVTGTARMRLVCVEGAELASVSACGEYNWGETEDYSVNIVSSSEDFPQIESVSPESIASGTSVVISGSNFENVSTVYFGGVAVEIESQTSSSLSVTAPQNVTAPITVVNDMGSDSYDDFTIEEYCMSEAIQDDYSIVSVFRFDDMEYFSLGECKSYQSFVEDEPIKVRQGDDVYTYIALGSCGAERNSMAKVYIDWNGDQVFTEDEEAAFTGTMSTDDFFEGSIEVPEDAVLGETKMRIVCVKTDNPDVIQPCGRYPHGETQDYTISIDEIMSANRQISNNVSVTSYPNPFNDITNFKIATPKGQHLKLEIHNVLGELVSVVFDQQLGSGEHLYKFNGNSLPAGTYIYKLTGEDVDYVGKIVKY